MIHRTTTWTINALRALSVAIANDSTPTSNPNFPSLFLWMDFLGMRGQSLTFPLVSVHIQLRVSMVPVLLGTKVFYVPFAHLHLFEALSCATNVHLKMCPRKLQLQWWLLYVYLFWLFFGKQNLKNVVKNVREKRGKSAAHPHAHIFILFLDIFQLIMVCPTPPTPSVSNILYFVYFFPISLPPHKSHTPHTLSQTGRHGGIF